MAIHIVRINPWRDWRHIRRFFHSIHIDEETGCWLWIKPLDNMGRGHCTFRGWHDRAHRNAYRLFHGPILAGHSVCHSCDTAECVNPAHLWQGTHSENMGDRDRKGRAKCGPRRYPKEIWAQAHDFRLHTSFTWDEVAAMLDMPKYYLRNTYCALVRNGVLVL